MNKLEKCVNTALLYLSLAILVGMTVGVTWLFFIKYREGYNGLQRNI